MNTGTALQLDIKDNKVKEGFLVKRSRHLKEWKERWMVLTKTHFYSFVQKGIYKDPTETICLKNIQTLKSYYKNQYDRPFTFRIQSPEANFHIFAKTNQEKWAWMTAIQKMTQRVIHPETKSDSYNLIRETIKMSSAVRNSIQKKQERKQSMVTNISQSQMKKFKLTFERKIYDITIDEIIDKNLVNVRQSQIFFKVNPRKQSVKSQILQTEKPFEKKGDSQKQIQLQKIIQKQVQVPIQKIVLQQKIVYVPQVKQKVVQKIVYKQTPSSQNLTGIIEQGLNSEIQNPKPIIDFVIWLILSKLKQYHQESLQICLKNPTKRFFSQKFLLILNDEINEENINAYLKFILVLYENNSEYFYSSQIKVLIDIICRELEFNRSEFNQFLLMNVLKTMSQKKWWLHQNHRKNDLRIIVKQIQKSSLADNQLLAAQLASKI